MKKKIVFLLTALLTVCLLAGMKAQKVSAAPWGARSLYTTPGRTRGTWYYKEGHHIRRWRITAHTSDGRKLYKVLPEKQYDKWWNKWRRAHFRGQRKIDRTMWQAYTFKWHGIKGFNSNAWLAGAGDGIYYVPVRRTRHGHRVTALRFGGGARNWVMFYAYRSRRLAK